MLWWYNTIKVALLAPLLFGFVTYVIRPVFFSLNHQPKLPLASHTVPAPSPQQTDSPQVILKETDLYLFGNINIKECQIQAEESKLFPQNNTTECTNIICKLTTNNEQIATLKAPMAYINHSTKTMSLPGKVTGSFKTWSLEKQDVLYQANSRTITAKQTRLTSQDGISVTANKSTIDLENETISLEQGVVSTFER